MIHKVDILRQKRQYVKKIILRNKRVGIGGEANEPVPARRQAEQDRGGAEVERNGRGAFGVRKIGLPDDVHVLRGLEDGVRLDGEGEALAVGVGRGGVEVEEVDVERVVGGVEQAEDPSRVAAGAGDEVGEGGRRGGGFVGVVDEAVGVGRVEKRVGSRVRGGGRGGEGEGEDEGEGEERDEEEGVEEEGGFRLWISEAVEEWE